MSVAAIMLVKDEADVVEYVVRYMLGQVDHLIVADNGSTDGTREKLDALLEEIPFELRDGGGYTATPPPQAEGLEVRDDHDPAYYQAQKTTALAEYARTLGHAWVVPCDADEVWYATDGRTLREFLGGLAPDVAYANAALYNHLPTALDPPFFCSMCGQRGEVPATPGQPGDGPIPCEICGGRVEPNPFRRIGWRQREHGALPKVAARLRPGLEIRQGNHSAYAPGAGLAVGGLVVRHFSWRSADQYCNPPEAPIWMADYSFRELGDVKVGDQVIGFGRVADRKKVAFLPSEVTAVHARRSPLVLVGFESGRSIHCSPDHLWLQHWYGRRDPNGTYKSPKVGRTLAHVIEPSFPVVGRDEWLAGWLAGIYDGEGYDRQIAQSSTHNPELYERICQALTHFEFPYTTSFDRIHLTGGRDAFVRFLNMVGPTRRSGPTAASLLGGAVGGRLSSPDKIVAVEPAGHGDVIGLTTTTGNYIAWGYASKNCKKIANGYRAYAATNLAEDVGAHWRMFGTPDEPSFEERVRAHFEQWFFVADPYADSSLIFDPAPWRLG